MTDRQRSIQNMQTALSMELTAVHQYLLHAHVLDDWGLDRLAARMRDEMQEELGHAEKLTDRILFLGGTPNVSEAKAPEKASGLLDLFSSDLKEEQSSIAFYTKAADEAREDSDVGTRVLFEKLVLDEEEHAEWLDLQMNLVERLGEPVYSSKQMSKTQ
jgi:bacterioferritin